MRKMARVAVGVSGGVDSAVTALLLKEKGYDVVGVTMALGRDGEEKSVAEAREVAAKLGIPFEVADLAAPWRREVLKYVSDDYLAGRTPNPCVRCNEFVKFGLLPRWAFETLHCDFFATGHYARTENGRLFRAVDRKKDQSYFLYRVSRDVLARTLFPLGEMTKPEVRELGRRAGIAAAEREDSQDFCGGDVKALVHATPRKGAIVRASDGQVLGEHPGYWNYTVGMRKGLGVGGGTPYYVIGIDASRNEVLVGTREESLRHDVELRDCVGEIDKTLPVKVRSAGEPRLLKDGISGLAPGQSAVFYRGDEVVGGGIIVD
jgi:tRNA-uridine 2-sulfurtransferase